jgi:hypothetical protein
MVRAKGHAPSILDSIKEQAQRIEEENPIIQTRYFVEEVTPSYRWHDGYDYEWIREQRCKVSPYFDSKREANKWLSDHLPDDGKRLEVMKQHLRRTVSERWWGSSRA